MGTTPRAYKRLFHMDQFNQAHVLLAGMADTANEFYQHAAQAIFVASGSRWGGVGFGNEASSHIEVVALWDGEGWGEPVTVEIAGSPFDLSLQATSEYRHVYIPSDLQHAFSRCEFLKSLGAESYRGQVFYDECQRIAGYIFALNDKPQPDSAPVRFFFDLLSQRMCTEYRRFSQQDELRRYTNMISITRNMLSFVDKGYRYRAVSQGYVDMFDKPHEQLVGKRVDEVHGQERFEAVIKPMLERNFRGESVYSRHWIHPPNSPPRYVDVRQTPYVEEDGTITGAVVSGHDITEQKSIEDSLRKLSLAITHSPVLTVITDPNGIIEYISPVVEKITGYRQEEVIGKTPSLFKSGRTDRKVYRELWSTIKNRQTWHGELENRRKSGEYYWERISIAPVVDERDELVAFVSISMDISQRKQLEQQLKELASTDPLTGIFNRRHFLEEMESKLAYSKRYGSPLSCMIIDIDHFKKINDCGGHALGDEAILKFTETTRDTIRIVDIFGRLGGDEFAIALPDTDREEALVLAERLKKKIGKITVENDLHSSQMTISIGLATFPNSGDVSESVNSLIARADRALYKAKRGGRNLVGVA